MVCQDEHWPNYVSRMLQHALWLVLSVASTSPQFFGSDIGFLWSRAGVNYTRLKYNYNCNYLASANYNYFSLGTITITFYQLQLLWDGNEKLKSQNFHLFAAAVEF